ncbi:MAG: chorismate mutase [Alphaproteobacteria bacterium]
MRADECQSMSDVRHEIDRIDRLLVELLAERQTYVARAARLKPTRDIVRDPARIEDVVEKVKIAAKEAGLSTDIAEPVWRTMIDQFISFEDREFVRNR